MKVERKKVVPPFEPITVTIETAEELQAVFEALYNGSQHNANRYYLTAHGESVVKALCLGLKSYDDDDSVPRK